MPWFNFFSSQPQKEPMEIPKPSTLTTSSDICAQVNPSDKGICWPLTNLYTKYQMGKGSHKCIEGSPASIYRRAVKEREHQIQLLSQKKDGLNSAFFDSGNDTYTTAIHPFSRVNSAEKLRSATKQGPHSIITYPVESSEKENTLHQVGIGQDRRQYGKCYFFDSEMLGFERTAPCDEIYQMASSRINKSIDPKAKEVFIGTDRFSPSA